MFSDKINRRDFLKISGVAAIGTLLSTTAFSQRKKKTCVVIGAGFSGLAAAFKLKNAGWNVTILEARTYSGGRVFSHRIAENPNLICELGAEWVGESHDRIMSLCKDFKLDLQQHRFADSLMINGKVSPPKTWGLSENSETKLKNFLKKVADEKLTQPQLEALDKKDWWTVLKDIGLSDDELRLRDLADSTDFGEAIRFVSGYAAAGEYAISGEFNEMDYKIIGGNSRLAEEFVKRIGEKNIKLNTLVTEINQVKGVVTVKTKDAKFVCDAVICTVPTASLQKIKFTPALPLDQQKAAESLIYARIIKNSVLYDERFWQADNFSLVTDQTSHYYFHSTQKQPGKQGILTAYAIGDKADVLASQDDKRRMEIITRDLASFNPNAPNLARGIASYAWQRDEFSKGAYALYRPGQWFGVRPKLLQPHGKILFSGEHLSDDWQGFMEGAIETGEAAAKSLIK
ncbi:MAG: FAD-dependent oxidoreductase [Pyrinomonadaceae bacterium]|nr:FAD-dependent oxidoreductase [Pyrinomonadaceae bacterium]